MKQAEISELLRKSENESFSNNSLYQRRVNTPIFLWKIIFIEQMRTDNACMACTFIWFLESLPHWFDNKKWRWDLIKWWQFDFRSPIESMKSIILIIVLLSWLNYCQGFRYPSSIMNYYNHFDNQVEVHDPETMETTTKKSSSTLPPEDVHRILEIIVNGLYEIKKLPLNFAKEKEIEENQRKKNVLALRYNRMHRI